MTFLNLRNDELTNRDLPIDDIYLMDSVTNTYAHMQAAGLMPRKYSVPITFGAAILLNKWDNGWTEMWDATLVALYDKLGVRISGKQILDALGGKCPTEAGYRRLHASQEALLLAPAGGVID